MSAVTAIRRGRVAAEADMLDTVTVQRQTSVTTDPETGVVTPTFATIYTGKAKVQQASPATTPTQVGEASLYVGQLVLHLPMSVVDVRPDDLVTVTGSRLDPDLPGRKFSLRGPAHKSFATARRFPMVEVSG